MIDIKTIQPKDGVKVNSRGPADIIGAEGKVSTVYLYVKKIWVKFPDMASRWFHPNELDKIGEK